jgi:hypothetical protein
MGEAIGKAIVALCAVAICVAADVLRRARSR